MTDEALIDVAKSAREHAYSPFSGFAVGAALLDQQGRLFSGCNVENLSFGLTMCAERVALGAAVSSGSSAFEVIAIISDSAEPVVPCGACRQVLAEFAPRLRIVSSNLHGARAEFHLDLLLPSPNQGILRRST
jgi:cytidine deaminase